MKKELVKLFRLLITITILVGLVGCGKNSNIQSTNNSTVNTSNNVTDNSANNATDNANAVTEKRKIVIATSGTGPAPYCYTDETGKLTGYDIEIITEIFNRLDNYEIEFQTTEFASIFTGIDAGYYQVGLNHLGYNHDRGEKYLFTDVYDVGIHAILVRSDNEDIKTVKDFGGHSTEITAASLNENSFLQYNIENPDNPIELIYTEDTSNTPLRVADGSIDFEYFTKITLQAQIEELGLTNVKLIDVPLEDSITLGGTIKGCFFIVAKDDTQLAADMNRAFEEMVVDGTVFELEQKWLGITKEEDYLTLEYIQRAREWIEADQAK